jgi:3-oxoacyl-[acyl-carrier protein] reductase
MASRRQKSKRVAVVTGAGRGIGRACALELSKAGWALVLLSRTMKELRAVGRMVGEHLAIDCDVTDDRAVRGAIQKTMRKFGQVDAVVHCAGVAPLQLIDEMTDETWRSVIDTNLSSAFYLARAVWPHFRKQRAGVIVNISSMASRDPIVGFSAYASAKGGVNLLGLALAREGAAHGIRVHTIAPGAVETSMFRALWDESQFPREKALSAVEVATIVADCVTGRLAATSGDVIYLQKSLV